MKPVRFSLASRFRWNDIPYEVRFILPDSRIILRHVLTGEETKPLEQSELIRELYDSKIVFEVVGKQAVKRKDGVVSTERVHDLLEHYKEKDVAIACYRLWAIRPLLSKRRTNDEYAERVTEIDEEIAGQTKVPGQDILNEYGINIALDILQDISYPNSVGSLKRWVSDYIQGGEEIYSLIPDFERSGRPPKRLDNEVERIIELAIDQVYMKREAKTIDDVLHEVAVIINDFNTDRLPEDKLPTPCRATIARRIAERPQAPFIATRHGKRAAERAERQYESFDYPDTPLAGAEYDETTSDLIIIDRNDLLPLGRTTIGWCKDVGMRYPLGYCATFEWPSSLTVMETLYHTILQKPDVRLKYGTQHDWIAHGLVGTLAVDNARHLRSPSLRQVCFELGIVLRPARVRDPIFKAAVESHMNTMNKMFFHKIPGTTFSNPQKRGDYNSAETACLFADEFDKSINTFIVDIYAESLHRGIDAIPARLWERATQKPNYLWPLPPDADRLRMLLGRMTHRAVFHYGIDLFSLRYNCDELGKIRSRLDDKEKVIVKFHTNDISRIFVYNRFEDEYLEVPVIDKYQEYTNQLSLWKHRVIRSAVIEARDEVDLVALGHAKRRIQAIIESGPKSSLKTRRNQARWQTSGNPTRDLTGGVMPIPMPAAKETASTADTSPPLPTTSPALPTPPKLPQISLESEDDGWSIASSPKSTSNTLDMPPEKS